MPNGPPALFDFLGDPPVPKHRVRAGLRWLARKLRPFTFFVFLSLFAHLALFGLVILLGPRPEARSIPVDVRAKDFEGFKESMREYAAEGPTPERLANALIALSEEEIRRAFYQAPVLDYRLTDREKTGLYKVMLAEALADFVEGEGEGPSAIDLPLSHYFGGLREMPMRDPGRDYALVRIDDPLEESARLYKLSNERVEALESLSLPAGVAKDRSAEVSLLGGEGRVLSVPGEYFYRDSPYVQIVAAGAGLFYVVKGFPELPSDGIGNGPDPAQDADAADGRRTNVSAQPPSPVFTVVLVPRGRPLDQKPAPSAAKPPLTLAEHQDDRVLDELMALPVIEQVRTFYRDYLEVYDPDSPDLARLTQGFIYRNLGMVFVQTGDPLSRGFDLLEEIYYDSLSQNALVPYALRNLRSRTAAEILFTLAATFEFERRAIVALDGSLDAAQRVLADPTEVRFQVHNKNVKAYVLREVYRDLVAELRSRDYPALEPVLQKYRDEQLRIYDHLKGMGGSVRCRALYALGRLCWDEGRTEEALSVWMETDPAYADETLTSIRNAIAEKRLSNPIRRIDDILGRLAVTEKADQLARIARYHKWDRR